MSAVNFVPKLQLPHLETNMTSVCQNRCVACNHFVPLDKPWYVDPAQVEHDMTYLSQAIHVEGWGALGGEPTLHKELVTIAKIVRASGIADKIEIHTNGQDIERLRNEFWYAFDKMVLTIYPGKHTDASLLWIQDQCKYYGLTLQINDERNHPNFTALLTDRTDDASAARRYRDCWFRTYSRVADGGFFFRCCTTPYIPRLMLGLPQGVDGLAITEHIQPMDVQNFLSQKATPKSCTVCAGRLTPEAHHVTWDEIKDPQTWIRRSGAPSLCLLPSPPS